MENIAILTGGDSSEYDISILSALNVQKNIDKSKFRCVIVHLKNGIYKTDDAIIDLKDFSYYSSNIKYKIDKVFIALHGPPAENGQIQDYFDSINLPYTSCNAKISALTFNKFHCNEILQKKGFKCAKSLLITKRDKIVEENIIMQIGLPFIVKPNSAGSSHGITVITEKNQLNKAISIAREHSDNVILESFIKGRELSCGIYFDGNKIKTLPITEIIPDNLFFDYEAKYEGASKEITPANINIKLTQKIQNESIKIYKKMQLSGLCRIDYIIEEKEAYIIEINTIPGLTEKSIIPQQIETAKMSLKEIFNLCLNNIN